MVPQNVLTAPRLNFEKILNITDSREYSSFCFH